MATDSAERAQATHATALFFVAAFGITWLLQLPALLAQRGLLAGPVDRYMLPAGLGAFGPLVAAVIASRSAARRAGVRALFRPLLTWRVGARWYLVAVGFTSALYVAAMAVYTLAGRGGNAHWLYPPADGQRIAAMIVFPIGEEFGWRGFALPRLQERHGMLTASLLVGLGWALWHLPMFLLAGATPGVFALSVAYILASSVTFSWIYNHTRGSLLIAILAHMGGHLNNPSQALPGNATPLRLLTVATCAMAVALLLGDRPLWRSPPRAGL